MVKVAPRSIAGATLKNPWNILLLLNPKLQTTSYPSDQSDLRYAADERKSPGGLFHRGL